MIILSHVILLNIIFGQHLQFFQWQLSLLLCLVSEHNSSVTPSPARLQRIVCTPRERARLTLRLEPS